MYDGRGNLLPGAVEVTGEVQGVWGGDGGGIIGRAQNDTSWASCRGEMELENLGHGGKSCGRNAWTSRPREARGAAWWRDAQDERQQGRLCGYILCTGMS